LAIGVEVGGAYDNPAIHLKRVHQPLKKIHLPEIHEFDPFVRAIEGAGGRFSKSCADLVRFLSFGGFRKTEAAFITWADCDFVKQHIVVRGDPATGTKNSEQRVVPMISEMRKLLENLKIDRANESATTPVMRVRECQKAIDKACLKLKITRITHHDLRHLFATRCIESGVDIPTVSRWLGHKDGGALAMRVYGHLRDQHSTAMAQKVSFTAKAN
jgi:integrase